MRHVTVSLAVLVIACPLLTAGAAGAACPAATTALQDPSPLALSSDGAHLYVGAQAPSTDDFALVVLAPDAGTGALALVQELREGEGGVSGLALPARELAIADDGAHLYVAGCAGLAIFARDGVTGMLTFVDVLTDVAGVGGLQCIRSMALSGDGLFLYAVNEGVRFRTYARDPLSGLLTEVQSFDPSGFPQTVVMGPGDDQVYVGDGANKWHVYTRDALTGMVTLASTSAGTEADNALVFSPDGSFAYSSNDNYITAFARTPVTGALTLLLTIPPPASFLFQRSALAISPDGAYLYVLRYRPGPGLSGLSVFAIDGGTGLPSLAHHVPSGPSSGVAPDLARSPDGSWLYATNFLTHRVSSFARDPGTGAVTLAAEIAANTPVSLAPPAMTAVSPDGGSVYATSFSNDSLGIFCREDDGRLVFVDTLQDGIAGVDGLAGVESLAISPDSATVYTAARHDHAIAVFDRDPSTGALGFVGEQRDGVGGVDGLLGARDVVVSPDGAHVYAAGMDDDAVVTFARDAGDGALTFVGTIVKDTGALAALNGPYSIALSPDGAHAYVTAYFANSVLVFSRNALSGVLSLTGGVTEGEGGVSGLIGPRDVLVSPDGAHVYVASFTSSSVAAFARDATTGALTFLESHTSLPLGSAYGLAVTGDGAFVYVTTRGGDSSFDFPAGVGLVYARNAGTGLLTENGGLGSFGFFDGECFHFAGLSLAPDDSAGYVLCSGSFGAGSTMNHYVVDPGDGTIELDEHISTQGAFPTDDPVDGCQVPLKVGASALAINNFTDDAFDKLKWKWGKGYGFPGPEIEIGGLRIYDASAAPQPVMIVGHGSCPSATCQLKPLGDVLKWINKKGTGLTLVNLKARDANRGRATVRAKGLPLGVPPAGLVPPVRVQMRAGDTCLEATYSTPTVNTADKFVAKSD